ncbi:hypothetical protein UA08_05022 [Talaromyces atroroseus]|uniref:Apple domain-containing protein n=1 Tax=Talaromyces atroroseus TaxID=1441469 RepID=A0A225AG98_TALAT|nr:hypothetical protein UA08_05022 [Talaromyces atroroseus]OKL59690.1 hypothetical protein UA08_05022 [Talaromyces atroroseus]
MHFLLLLGFGEALLASARPLGSGSAVHLPRNSLPQCANDPVWIQFQYSPLQAQASAFCSAFIGQTVTQAVTVQPTTTRIEPVTTITEKTVDVTVTDTLDVLDTVTQWYSSTAIVPVTITSVIEDIVPTTDFITTTDATSISTATDVVTTSVTDTTVTSTVVSTDAFTTTDATVYATQTSTLSMTVTDATVTNTITSFRTVSTVATLVQTIVQRDVEVEDDQEYIEACPAPEPECTSPDCLFSSWLDEVSTIATSDLSSACSCLVVPATTTTTVLTTGSQAPSIFATATSRVTAFQGRTSSHIVSATSVISETLHFSRSVTQTIISPTTRYIHATASSSAIVTRVATENKAASTTITSVESVTIDETASATSTVVASATIDETASTTISVTETRTATVSPTSCAQLPNPYYDATAGRTYELQCGYEYSYSAFKIVGLDIYVTFAQCLSACSTYSTCHYVQYDHNVQECFLLNAVTGGQAESVVDVAQLDIQNVSPYFFEIILVGGQITEYMVVAIHGSCRQAWYYSEIDPEAGSEFSNTHDGKAYEQ